VTISIRNSYNITTAAGRKILPKPIFFNKEDYKKWDEFSFRIHDRIALITGGRGALAGRLQRFSWPHYHSGFMNGAALPIDGGWTGA
jgi:hypothetical protein